MGATVERDVVGNEFPSTEQHFRNWMATTNNVQHRLFGHLWTNILLSHSEPGKCRQCIYFSYRSRNLLDLTQVLQYQGTQLCEQFLFKSDCSLFSMKDLIFVFLEFRRHKPFGVGQGLFARIL